MNQDHEQEMNGDPEPDQLQEMNNDEEFKMAEEEAHYQ